MPLLNTQQTVYQSAFTQSIRRYRSHRCVNVVLKCHKYRLLYPHTLTSSLYALRRVESINTQEVKHAVFENGPHYEIAIWGSGLYACLYCALLEQKNNTKSHVCIEIMTIKPLCWMV